MTASDFGSGTTAAPVSTQPSPTARTSFLATSSGPLLQAVSDRQLSLSEARSGRACGHLLAVEQTHVEGTNLKPIAKRSQLLAQSFGRRRKPE